MPFVALESCSPQLLRPYQGTKDSQLCTFKGKGHDFGLFVAESKNVIERALASDAQPLSVLVEDAWFRQSEALLAQIESQHPQAVLIRVTHEQFQRITGYETTRGALACFARPKPACAQDLLRDARRVAVLEDVTNCTNIGAIFRSAAALGIDAVLLTPSCHDPLYRRASRVSMGTVFQVPWARIGLESDWAQQGVPLLRNYGFATVALALVDDSLSVDDARLKKIDRLAFVLGSEGFGLRASTIASCDYTVKIPMSAGVDSLNVAAASAVAFWELRAPRLLPA